MKSYYKRLGDYIREVNNRNTNLKDVKLLGVSIQKVFMPSIANTIGTDMSTYKLIRKNQFSYGPVTSRNGDKISVALLDNYDEAMISQAYTSFEVIDTTKLLPDYLMMWFRRPEFDRYARFMSHGSAREIFGWEEMCNTTLPIPPITRQTEIVREYSVLADRINLNNLLVERLEETAQDIYKHWFVDFEFPDENGKPYKSNGGEMEFNKTLDSEVPKGWGTVALSNVISVKDGTHDSPEPSDFGFPLVTSTHLNLYDISLDETYNISEEDFIQINKRSKVEKFDILFSMIGTVGLISYVLYDQINFAIKNVGLFKTSERKDMAEYILFYLKSDYVKQYIASNPNGSTQNYVTLGFLREMSILLPPQAVILKFEECINAMIGNIHLRIRENNLLNKMQNIMLSKLATKG